MLSIWCGAINGQGHHSRSSNYGVPLSTVISLLNPTIVFARLWLYAEYPADPAGILWNPH